MASHGPRESRCTSQDSISPVAALLSWYRKYHQYLTDECKEDFFQYIALMITNEAGHTSEEPTQTVALRTNYAEGGKATTFTS